MSLLSVQMARRVVVRVTAILGFLLVYGCAYMPVSQVRSEQGNVSALPEDLCGFLDAHREAAASEFAASPWGSGVVVKAGPVYFAAIGEYCRRIFVDDAQGEQALLACQESRGEWYTRRLVVPLHQVK